MIIFFSSDDIDNWYLNLELMQLPDSMKQSQADLYLETYQVLDLEMSRLREIQRWQSSAASKVCHFNFLILPFYIVIQCIIECKYWEEKY